MHYQYIPINSADKGIFGIYQKDFSVYTDMRERKVVHMAKTVKRGRPVGTGKPPGERFVLKAFKFPPGLWEAFRAVVPRSERSATIRRYVELEVQRRRRKGG